MGSDTKILPALDEGETYTDPDFLLVQTSTDHEGDSHTVIDRMFSAKREDDTGSWVCKTITARTRMSHGAALAMAKVYAAEHEVPVIYQHHEDARYAELPEFKSNDSANDDNQ